MLIGLFTSLAPTPLSRSQPTLIWRSYLAEPALLWLKSLMGRRWVGISVAKMPLIGKLVAAIQQLKSPPALFVLLEGDEKIQHQVIRLG